MCSRRAAASCGCARADPADKPVIKPNYLSTDEDRRVAAELDPGRAPDRRRSRRSPSSGRSSICPGPSVGDDDAALIKAAGDIGTTIFHPVGTAKMGRDSDPTAVVDERLRVIGLERLRVVDASVMPTITSGNTNAPTMMIAEKGAAMIREDCASRHVRKRGTGFRKNMRQTQELVASEESMRIVEDAWRARRRSC